MKNIFMVLAKKYLTFFPQNKDVKIRSLNVQLLLLLYWPLGRSGIFCQKNFSLVFWLLGQFSHWKAPDHPTTHDEGFVHLLLLCFSALYLMHNWLYPNSVEWMKTIGGIKKISIRERIVLKLRFFNKNQYFS